MASGDGERLFVIGDVHGCVRELGRLLGSLRLGAADTVVFVGDYIDRGPDSRGVIDLLLDWRRGCEARSVFLKGNHEDMALAYMGRGGHWGEAWFRNGATATLRSYGLGADLGGGDVAARLPPPHLEFLEGLTMHHRWGGYLLVHAGIRPGVPWEGQDTEDLLWIREEFLDRPHDLGVTVVFGHTPYRRVLVDLPYKIGVDTGCVYGGALTCLELPSGTLRQVRLGSDTVHRDALPAHGRRPA